MKITGPQVISELREKLQFDMGRHLYAVMGTYGQLSRFEQDDLAQARDPQGNPFPPPINVNRRLLARIGDDDLRQLGQSEALHPEAVKRKLGRELENLLAELLKERSFLILKQLEIIFAYSLDLGVFRTQATNQSHVLVLLPGERRSERITLFHEGDPRFCRFLPPNLVADNHLWELRDG